MKLNINNYVNDKEYIIDEDIDFSYISFSKNSRIRCIRSCNFKGIVNRYDDLLKISITMKGEVIGVCSYTLEEFPIPYFVKEELSFNKEENDVDYQIVGCVIDLDPILVSLIDNVIPLNPKKPGAKIPKSGNNYRVLTEDELIKERNNKNKKDSRWSALDDINLD